MVYIPHRRRAILGPHFSAVSDALLSHILSYLPLPSICSISLASRKLHEIASSDPVWRILYASRFLTQYVPAFNLKTSFLVRLEYAKTENGALSYKSLDPISILSDETHVLTVLKHELLLNSHELALFQKERIHGEDFLHLTPSELREEFPNLTYATRKRILNYIDMVKHLPDIEHESVLRHDTLDKHLDQEMNHRFENIQIDLMDRVQETLNEIGILLQMKGCGHLMPVELTVTRVQMERCANMLRRGEVGEERYNNMDWGDELPIHHFNDVWVLTRTDRDLHFGVLRNLRKRELNASHYLREEKDKKLRPVPPPMQVGDDAHSPQSPSHVLRRFKVNGIDHVEERGEMEHMSSPRSHREFQTSSEKDNPPSAHLPSEMSQMPSPIAPQSRQHKNRMSGTHPEQLPNSPRSPLSTDFFDSALCSGASPRSTSKDPSASFDHSSSISVPPRSKMEEEILVRLLTNGGSSPRQRFSLSLDHPSYNSSEGLASSSPRAGIAPIPPSKRRNSNKPMSPRRVHALLTGGASPARRHQSALVEGSSKLHGLSQGVEYPPRRKSMFPPIHT
eukprot:CAMPEP_0117441704 /NCGR_PEP_ID=MMETSP0759-20121206/3770_1 /TAXON_ID=63605 /ORGANISM="Percolomonas cosmopolitus, Strain WS" /LENGTH=564 /DNA_ID=CAMNT_0005233563 /DNA_START=36 /DNA_END=1727 /DNA_ORIENTATION=+